MRKAVPSDSRQKTPREDIYLGYLILLLLAVLGTGTYFGWGMKRPTVPPTMMNVDQILQAPLSYVGKEIKIAGTVTDIAGPNAFTISNPPAGKGEILVVRAAPAGAVDVSVGEIVTVGGTVHIFDVARFEQDLDVDLKDDLLREWPNKPAIAATALTRLK